MATGDPDGRMNPEGVGFAKAMATSSTATAFEAYDFAVYGYVAVAIGYNFFPAKDPLTSLLFSFGVFGVGFLARPVGGIVIGRIADLQGRKPAIVICILLMAAGTLLTGVAPTYTQIGALAPVLIVTARLLQGIAVGGGATSGIVFISEWAPEGRRGLYGGLQQCGAIGGFLLGSLIAALDSTLLSKTQFQAWGWRIPFIIGVSILPVGLYMLKSISETPIFIMERRSTTVNRARKEHALWQMSQAFGVIMLWTSALYTLLSYMPTFMQSYASLTTALSLWANVVGLIAVLAATPFFGYVSDRIGRRPVLLAASAAFVLLPYPLLNFAVSHASFGSTIVTQLVLGIMLAALCGVCPATISEIFPTHGRTMRMSISYGLAVAIFGGFAPYVATWLIRETGLTMAPAFYVMGNAVVTGLVSLRLRETAHLPLN